MTKAPLHKYENDALQRAAAAKGVKPPIPLEGTAVIIIVALQILLALSVAYVAYYGLTEASAMNSILEEPTHDKSFTDVFLSLLASLFRVYS